MRHNANGKTIVLNTDDIKALIAKRFGVGMSNVIRSQYSFVVVGADDASALADEESK